MFGTTTSTMTSFAESLEDDAFGFSAARATAPLTCLDDVLEDLDEVIEGWFNGDGGDDAATDIV